MTKYHLHRSPADTAAGAETAPAPADQLSTPFWQVIVLGVATTLFGIIVLIWPGETLRTLGFLIGIWLMVVGAARIVGAFATGRGLGRQVLSGTVGVILLIGGVACLRNVANGVLVLVAEFVIALQATGSARTWLLVLAVVSVAIGLAFTFWPGLSLATIVLMTGISALIIGIGEIAFAFQMRRIAATP
jgi:uncharacterized membrane protein HdeD (DUF308 family)